MLTVMGGNNPTSYNLTRSLRFRSSASAYLNRTYVATATDYRKYTFSAWVKLGALGVSRRLIDAGVGSDTGLLNIGTNGALNFAMVASGVGTDYLVTNNLLRDPSAWYHIVFSCDTSVASNQFKFYINGVQATYSTNSSITLNYGTYLNSGGSVAQLGRSLTYAQYFDGYMAEVNFIDGQTLTPSSFGSTNATTGVWQPARYAGTYGANGGYWPFTDNSALTTSSNVGLGRDYSGNSNYWTTNNISITAGVTYDSMTDVPTLTSAASTNFCTMNPVYVSNIKAAPTLADANLTINPLYDGFMNGTIALPSSGKFYWEATVVTATTGTNQTALGVNTNQGNNRVQHNFVPVLNDVWGVAVDIDSLSVSWYKNNVLDTTKLLSAGLEYFPFFYTDTNPSPTQKWAANFGQRPFTYTPPTGYKTLNTFNLPNSTIVKGNTVMDATLYTGNGSTQTITNAAGFRPDLVWYKGRSVGYNHAWFDSVRGATNYLASNLQDAEIVLSGVTAFNSNGFTLGSSVNGNNSGTTYVGWQWQAGQGSSSSNTAGSITSTVSVNANAGFSVVNFTSTGVVSTIGHGLGVAPAFIIGKAKNAVTNWIVYHASLGPTQVMFLNSTGATATSSIVWNNTAPTSSVITVGTGVVSGNNVIAYCWAEIPGYSKFGSYAGNSSTDGPFVYTGFRPKFVMIKEITSGGTNWNILDTARDIYNVEQKYLAANLSDAEGTLALLDGLSNGFKLRSSGLAVNQSGSTYIYAAFAENPFKNALAR
jgi:hypothetical protein